MLTIKDFGSVEPIFVAKVPRSKSPRFSFVTIQKPSDIKDRKKQSTVRKHAKRESDRARSKQQRSRIEILPSPSGPDTTAFATVDHVPSHETRQEAKDVALAQETQSASNDSSSSDTSAMDPGPSIFWKPLGAGRGLTPFTPYPIHATDRIIQLLDHLLRVEKLHNRPIRLLWISIAMSDEDAFNITLAHASNMLTQSREEDYGETPEALQYYNIALKGIGKRLQSDKDGTSDGVIGTILGFACLDITYRNWKRWNAHMDGIKSILKLRGGVESLRTSQDLQMTIFWNDVGGSLTLDNVPRFPIPKFAQQHLTPRRSSRIQKISEELTSRFPDTSDILECLGLLRDLTVHAEEQGISSEQWEQDLFIATKVHPIAHKLLSIPRFGLEDEIYTDKLGILIRKVLRLAGLLLIGLLKAYCHTSPTGIVENQSRISRLLTTIRVDWSPFEELHLWVLTICAIAADGDRSFYVREIASVMKHLGVAEWHEALSILKELIWVSCIFDQAADILGTEV